MKKDEGGLFFGLWTLLVHQCFVWNQQPSLEAEGRIRRRAFGGWKRVCQIFYMVIQWSFDMIANEEAVFGDGRTRKMTV